MILTLVYKTGIYQKNISSIIRRASHIVTVSDRLKTIGEEIVPDKISTIKCACVVEHEWQNVIKNWRGRWRKDQLDILFPADPRRPEKNHYLALQTGEELERRGWKIGITTLRQQPRSIVWDRMLVADLTHHLEARIRASSGARINCLWDSNRICQCW